MTTMRLLRTAHWLVETLGDPRTSWRSNGDAGCFASRPEMAIVIMTLVAGLIGIAILVLFLDILLWWIKAVPLTLIVVLVILLLVHDFVQTLRSGDSGAGR